MKRNITKHIEEGKALIHKNPRKDLSMSELDFFYDDFQKTAKATSISNGVFCLIEKCYLMGVAAGHRTKTQQKRGNHERV